MSSCSTLTAPPSLEGGCIDMTKLDIVLERVRKLPSERQEAIALEIGFLLDIDARASLLTDEEWAAIEPTLDDDREDIPHKQVVAEIRAKFPG